MARFLISEGVGPSRWFAVAMGRSLDQLVALYAVTVAGGAYVPVDPDQPARRNAYILETANPVLLLTTSREHEGLPAVRRTVHLDTVDVSGYSDAPVTAAERPAPLRPDNAAYVVSRRVRRAGRRA
ncbi:AMP-binding protein [Rhodococcus hoagii]|nr:AMP-binding protein [Prescottella equi]NKZ87442.1 AMP-binding protein [Prescottella equi]